MVLGYIRVKEEPSTCQEETLNPYDVNFNADSLHTDTVIKEEPQYNADSTLTDTCLKRQQDRCVDIAAQAELYANHEVKDELVLGPELLFPMEKAHIALESLDWEGTCKQNPLTKQAIKLANPELSDSVNGKLPPDAHGESSHLISIKPPYEELTHSVSKHQPQPGQLSPPLNRKPIVAAHHLSHQVSGLSHTLDGVSCKSMSGKSKTTHEDSHFDCRKPSQPSSGEPCIFIHGTPALRDCFVKLARVTISNEMKPSNLRIKHLSHRHQRREGDKKPKKKKVKKDNKMFICDTCKKQFNYRRAFIRHFRTHMAKQTIPCDICGKLFATNKYMKKHLIIHMNKPFSCNVCDCKFKLEGSLVAHQVKHNDKHIFCDVCGKKFVLKASLDRHKLIHTGEKPYHCDACERSYSTKGCLNRHKLKHKYITEQEIPFPCDLCPKKFFQKCGLTTHKLSHTEENPYSCELCDKSFKFKISLVRHLDIHSGMFRCNICKKNFARKQSLAIHKRIHTGEKPYGCEICKKSFRHKTTLVDHIRAHNGVQPYACNLCSKRWTTKSNMLRHKRIAHFLV